MQHTKKNCLLIDKFYVQDFICHEKLLLKMKLHYNEHNIAWHLRLQEIIKYNCVNG